MITLAWYFLKVIICSGILCGYYFLALRNKAFHRWNRFYILASVVISLLVPIMKINFFPKGEEKGTVVQMLQTISYGDEAVVEYSRNNSFQLTTQNITEGFYLLISTVFFSIFLLSLYKITRLKKKFPAKEFEGIRFINTTAKGTPFSFFKSIFWNKAIDLHSKPGQQIFNHEIAHIKEKHSYDKIFMNIVLIFFWINPFFWLMQKELFMIHEFIADKEALEDSDISAFAEMVLQTVYPGQNFSLANNFFYSPIKRRLLMLNKNKNPKVSYISRLLVLPLAAIVFFAFTLKVKNRNTHLYDGKTITVIIDAGHGGKDNGAVFNGIKEKDINLSIAKKIADLNSNSHLKIILSRDNDQTISVKDRVVFAKNNNADLFIAVHVNASINDAQLNGFSVLVVKNHNEQDQLLGSALINELKKSYKTEDKIGERDRGVWILDHNVCPAALVQCGFLSNAMDLAFINNSADQEKIAQNILDAINVYASSKENADNKGMVLFENSASSTSVTKDSIPPMYYKNKKVTRIRVYESKDTVNVKYADGSKETITKEEALKRGFTPPPPPPGLPPHYFNTKNLFIIDGKISTNAEAKNIDPNKIKSVTILKQSAAVKKYGNKGKNGAIEIITKNKSDIHEVTGTKTYWPDEKNDSIPKKVFTKVQTEASFPGGMNAWPKYISGAIQNSIDKFTKADYGTCVIRFIVNVDGTVSDLVATTMKGTELAKVSIRAIENGPKWIPASQNGKTVASYRLQPVTLSNPGNKQVTIKFLPPKVVRDSGNVYVNPDGLAKFPGGQSAWLKYISMIINKHGNQLTANKNNIGTCKVKFVVNTKGKVSEVHATTMEGTELAEVVMNAIKDGPYWVPGKQNGQVVNSFVIQPVTFKLSDHIMNEPE